MYVEYAFILFIHMFVSLRTLQECFETENKGIQISSEYAKCLIGNPDAAFPVLGPDTTEDDLKEAL